MAKRGQFYPYRIKYAYPNGVKGSVPLMSLDDVNREVEGFLRRGADLDIYEVDRATRGWHHREHTTPDDLPEEPRECGYVYGGSYNRAPEYCDLDAGEGSEYCAGHRALVEGDDSDEPVWALEAD